MTIHTVLQRALPTAPALANALAALTRGEPSDLSAYLTEVEREFVIDGTRTISHVYTIAVDSNGLLRTQSLIERICEQVLDYAIPRTRIQEAYAHFERTGSSRLILRLAEEARSVFTDIANTGEGGELLLFAFAESVLQLPQIICKMSLKTSGRMHYHGADGVHARIDPDDGVLHLYWGESKMHRSHTAAINACLTSLAPYLLEPPSRSATRGRDVQLLSGLVDLDNPAVEAAIKEYLDPDSTASNQVKYCGLALVGFNSNCYPSPPALADADKIAVAVTTAVRAWKNHIGKRLVAERLEAFDIHLLCLPFPSVDGFRTQFLAELGVER